MRESSRAVLIVALACCFVLVLAGIARADDWNTGSIMTSSSQVSNIKDVEVTIASGLGAFWFTDCAIPTVIPTSPCDDTGFNIAAGTNNNACSATVVYKSGPPSASRPCVLGSAAHPADPGTGTERITDPSGCAAFSYAPKHNTSADIAFDDGSGHLFTVVSLTWSASTKTPIFGGEQWNINAFNFTGQTVDPVDGHIYVMKLSMTGTLQHIGTTCSAVTPSSVFNFTVSGTSEDLQMKA